MCISIFHQIIFYNTFLVVAIFFFIVKDLVSITIITVVSDEISKWSGGGHFLISKELVVPIA